MTTVANSMQDAATPQNPHDNIPTPQAGEC